MAKKPTYTQDDWFELARKTFDSLLEEFKGKPNIHGLEIGSFEGRSASWLLENVLTHESSRLTCVEPFIGSQEYNERELNVSMREVKKNFFANMERYKGKWNVIQEISQTALRRKDMIEKFDFIYVDGSHEACDALEDIVLAYRAVKRGGLLIFDDYMWNYNKYPDHMTPRIAIDAFLGCFKGKITCLHMGWKTVVVKRIK